jgi:hypothetical protein
LNGEDVDIWSTSDDIPGDEQFIQKRNGAINYRSHHTMMAPIHSDSQSIRSIESHTSQQEIMPAEIRRRLSEVKTTGPILFDVK